MPQTSLAAPAGLAPPRPRRVPLLLVAPLAFWALLAGIGLLIVYPLVLAIAQIAGDAWSAPGSLLAGTTPAGLAKVLWNTAVVVLSGSALALLAGAALACVSERTDASLGALGELLPLAPMVVPPIAGVIGWAVLLDPNAGLLNTALRAALASIGVVLRRGPFNIYSMAGLVGMTGLSLVPYVYLVVSAALRRLDPAIEEASRVCGAPPLPTLLKVTLPAIAPALVAAFLIALVAGIGLFSVPIVLGTAARVDVLSTTIYRLLDSYPPHTGAAVTLAAGLALLLQLLLWAQRLVAPDGRHAATGGRGVRAGRLQLGRWKHPARLLVLLYLGATAVLPVGGLILVSLQPFWTPAIRWGSLSLANYHDVILGNDTTRQALLTSLLLGAAVATSSWATIPHARRC
jgi:iron(III) transport system permease protein